MARPRGIKNSSKGSSNRSKGKSQNLRPDTASSFDPSRSRIKALNDWDQDDMRDEEDEFFEGEDKILLDQNRTHQNSDDESDIPDQLLKLHSETEESSDGEDSRPEDERIDEVKKKTRKPKKKVDNSSKGRYGKKQLSDPDVDSESDIEDEKQASLPGNGEFEEDQSSQEDDEEDETWKSYHVLKSGRKKSKKKRDDPDEVERRALELEEVKRLQIRAREKLTNSDFNCYLDYASEDELARDETVEAKQASGIDSQSGQVKKFDSEPEAVAFLLKTKPEALALVNDFRRSLVAFSDVQDEIFKKEKPESNEFRCAITWLHYHIMATYISITAFYIHLSLKIPKASPSLLSEVTKSLVELRTTINLMEQVGLIGDDKDSGIVGSGFGSGDNLTSTEVDDELRNLLYDQSSNDYMIENIPEDKLSSGKKRKASDSGNEKIRISIKSEKKQKKEKEKSKNKQLDDPNLYLKNLPSRSLVSSGDILRLAEDLDKDFIEPSLSENSKDSKKSKKKDLRFYTSKIDAKGKRREKAIKGLSGYSGGSETRVVKKQDHSLAVANDMDVTMNGPEDNEEEGYYNTIKELKRSAKLAKKKEHDERNMAERDALTAEEAGSGPREITRQILKNKGLTPKRAKENRNPRVKKRLRFEKANKKISSQRPVYKADQAAKSRELNGYSGEKTGVKVNVVKSRKL
ncbi:Sas10 C-terminal domain-domain-containing protein [Phakopsora pachyrhizi]|uniref:Sas10 C-terminal domain-domain-containing protein n=1 Tax=Phakopsora pachyrhizi TaxID=170000 RepID=A0AAV0BPI2_PHAPC|nr:Sas10 C-terminal domain-domain-containing protein [Phakopsora pachyrhizi]